MTPNTNQTDNVTQLHPEQDDSDETTASSWGEVITPVDEEVGAEVFDDVIDNLRHYLHIDRPNAMKVAFWIAHANCFEEFQHTPRLLVTAPTRGCGKTLLITVMQWMTNKSIQAGKVTSGAFVRLCAEGDLTFYVDEADRLFTNSHDEMTTALNNGWEQGGNFIKCTGDNHLPTQMNTHSAVTLAGIDLTRKLQGPTLDRAIVVEMEKAQPGDLPGRFRHRTHQPIFRELGQRLLRWCNDHQQQMEDHEPNIPDSIEDRHYNKWEPLVSIAELASPKFGEEVLRLVLNEEEVDGDDLINRFLRNGRSIYDRLDLPEHGVKPYQGSHAIGFQPSFMAEELGRLEDPDDPGYRPWARYHADKREEQDARIGGRDVTKILKGLNIKKTTLRWGHEPKDVFNGFKWTDLLNAQRRYAPLPDDVEYVPGEDRNE